MSFGDPFPRGSFDVFRVSESLFSTYLYSDWLGQSRQGIEIQDRNSSKSWVVNMFRSLTSKCIRVQRYTPRIQDSYMTKQSLERVIVTEQTFSANQVDESEIMNRRCQRIRAENMIVKTTFKMPVFEAFFCESRK